MFTDYINSSKLYRHVAPRLWLFYQLLPGWKHGYKFHLQTRGNDFRILLYSINNSSSSPQRSLELARKIELKFAKSGKEDPASWRQLRASKHRGCVVLDSPGLSVPQFRSYSKGQETGTKLADKSKAKLIRLKPTVTLSEVFDAYSNWLFFLPAEALVLGEWGRSDFSS